MYGGVAPGRVALHREASAMACKSHFGELVHEYIHTSTQSRHDGGQTSESLTHPLHTYRDIRTSQGGDFPMP